MDARVSRSTRDIIAGRSVPVNLTEELQGNLRQLKAQGSMLFDEVRAMAFSAVSSLFFCGGFVSGIGRYALGRAMMHMYVSSSLNGQVATFCSIAPPSAFRQCTMLMGCIHTDFKHGC